MGSGAAFGNTPKGLLTCLLRISTLAELLLQDTHSLCSLEFRRCLSVPRRPGGFEEIPFIFFAPFIKKETGAVANFFHLPNRGGSVGL